MLGVKPPGCECHCGAEDPPPCSGVKSICAVPSTGVMRRCLNGDWTSGNPWQNETPHKVTTFTGVAGFDFGLTCVCDIVGRIWRKRDHPNWHVYDVVHTAGVPLNDLAFVVRQQGKNEEQEVVITGGPTGGSFTLTFDDTGSNPQTTGPIAWPYTLDSIESALEALSNLDDVEITAIGAGDFLVEFRGDHARENVRKLTIDASSLTGPDPISGSVQTVQNGQAHITVGIAVGNNGTILRSADHGATWAAVPSGTTETLNRVIGSGQYWFAGGTNGKLLRSSDHGVTWSAMTTGTTETVRDIAVARSVVWLAASAVVLRSTDRAVSFATITGISDSATCVVTDGINTAWVFTSAAGTPGKCWKSTDDGANWTAHTLTGQNDNETKAGLYFAFGGVPAVPAAVYVASSHNVSSPTLSELRWAGSQDSIARFGRDLYICGANAEKPLPAAPNPPSLCPTEAAATMWTVNALESATFTYCNPGVALTQELRELIQDVLNPAWPACVWRSRGCNVPCNFVPGGPVAPPWASWELDTSSDPITLTFTGSQTAVYECPAADWNHNAANLMTFASGTAGPTGHAELWVCPGEFTESIPCRTCDDNRCESPPCWDITFSMNTNYHFQMPPGSGPPFGCVGCDGEGKVSIYWLWTGAWPAAPMVIEAGAPGGHNCGGSRIWALGDTRQCEEAVIQGECEWHLYDCGLQALLSVSYIEDEDVFRFTLILIANDGDLTGIVWNAKYELDLPGQRVIDCSASYVLPLIGPWLSDWSTYNPTSWPTGTWFPNAPWLDLPATITVTPLWTCP